MPPPEPVAAVARRRLRLPRRRRPMPSRAIRTGRCAFSCRTARAASPTPRSACWRRSSTSASASSSSSRTGRARAASSPRKAGATRAAGRLHADADRQRHGHQQVAVQVAALRRAPRLQVGLGDGLARSHDRDQGGRPAQDRVGHRRGGEERSRQAEFRHHRARQHAASVGGTVPADGRHQGHDGDLPHHARSRHRAAARRRRCRLRLSRRLPRSDERPAASRRGFDRRKAVAVDSGCADGAAKAACRTTW